MSLRRITSTLSSEFLLCLFLKNRINSRQSFCQRALFWSDTLCYLSILFYFCIFEMFLKIYRKLKRKKKKKINPLYKSGDRGARAVSRKAAPLGSEPQWRLWEERTEHREHRSSSQSTAPQRPGRPPASHRTPSPSCALLGPQVFICENTRRASLRESWDT